MGEGVDKIIDKELGAIEKALSSALDKITEEVFNNGEKEDFDSFEKFAGFLQCGVGMVIDNQKENIKKLFDCVEDNRETFSVIANALRGIHRKYHKSFVHNAIVSLLGLEEIEGVFLVHRDLMLDLMKYGESVLAKFVELGENMDEAVEIAAGFVDKERDKLYNDTDCWRYAILKSFETRDDMNAFFDDIDKSLELFIEVFIVSPMELYLQLSRDGMTLVWKLLSFSKSFFKKEANADVNTLQNFVINVFKTAVNEGAFKYLKELKTVVPEKYAKQKRKQWEKILDIFKSRTDKETFLRRFETGAIFK